MQARTDVIRKEAWSFDRAISGVRLCWELEEPEGPKALANPCRLALRRRATTPMGSRPPSLSPSAKTAPFALKRCLSTDDAPVTFQRTASSTPPTPTNTAEPVSPFAFQRTASSPAPPPINDAEPFSPFGFRRTQSTEFPTSPSIDNAEPVPSWDQLGRTESSPAPPPSLAFRRTESLDQQRRVSFDGPSPAASTRAPSHPASRYRR